MLKTSITMFITLLYTMCLQAQNNITIRIDPDNARGGTSSQIFDTIRYTPLETTTQSLFGAINQLEVTDEYFIILDIDSRSILLFRRDGSFHSRIKPEGSDKLFNYFTVDRKNKHLIVTNNYADGLLEYDFQGLLIKKIPRPEKIRSVYTFDSNILIYNPRRTFNKNKTPFIPYDIIFARSGTDSWKLRNPYDPQTASEEYNIEYNPFNYSGQPGSCMFSLPFDYKVYQLNDTGILRTYNFVFPAQYSLPHNFATDSAFKGERAKYVYLNQDNRFKKHGISATYHINDYLLFTAMNGEMRTGADLHYLYNLKTGSLISFSKVSPDSSSYYIPMLSSIFEQTGTVYNNKIYTSTPSFRVFGAKKQIDKRVQYPASLQNYMTTGSKDNNPIIVELAPKQNL